MQNTVQRSYKESTQKIFFVPDMNVFEGESSWPTLKSN